MIIPGRYIHYKGNKYEVLCTARHSETLEDMVVYRALYGDGEIWVRPASMWEEMIDVNGTWVKRFTYIDKMDEKQVEEWLKKLNPNNSSSCMRR